MMLPKAQILSALRFWHLPLCYYNSMFPILWVGEVFDGLTYAAVSKGEDVVSKGVINPNNIKSYKNYLQNTQHMVLSNRPTLSLGTERLACLNSPLACSWGPSPSTRQVPGSSPGSGGRDARAFFPTLPSFLLREIVFFAPSPPTPQKC